MSNELSSNQGSLHDLTEFSFSTSVYKDFPDIIKNFETTLETLYPYAHYAGVAPVIAALEENRTLLRIQFSYYKNIYINKGEIK